MEHDRSTTGTLRRRSLAHRLVCQGRGAIAALRAARRDHAAGYGTLLARFFDLYVRRQYSLDEIRWLDLLAGHHAGEDLDVRPSKQTLLAWQLALNPRSHWSLARDKRVFDLVCRGAGLPVPRSHGVVDVAPASSGAHVRAAARGRAAELLRAARGDELLLKPVRGVHGSGVRHLRRAGERFACSDGVCRAGDEVYDWLAGTAAADGAEFIVQDHLKTHDALRRLTGSVNLGTVRMVTLVTRTGDVFVGGCELRIIVGTSLVDNFRNGRGGNLIGEIPAAAGRVRQVFGLAPGGVGCARIHRHPLTGQAFDGFEIPCWEEACGLVRRAARAMLPLRTIGWDVGITDAGPVLVEGNVAWDPANEGSVGAEVIRAIRSDAAALRVDDEVARTDGTAGRSGLAGDAALPQR